MEKITKERREELRRNAVETVKRLAPEGARVAYLDISFAKSGASRRTVFIVCTPDNGFFRLDMALARVLGYAVPDKGQGVLLRGYGEDTGWSALDNLSRVVYGRPGAFKPERL